MQEEESLVEETLDLFDLHDAAERGEAQRLSQILEIIQGIALEEGEPSPINIDLLDESGCSPLHAALLEGQVECIKLLLGAGASPSKLCEGSPALLVAISAAALPRLRTPCLDIVNLLLSHDASPFQRDDNGRTALHFAAANGLVEVCNALLEASVREAAEHAKSSASDDSEPDPLLFFQDARGQTALHAAARNNQAAVLRCMLQDGPPWHGKQASTLARKDGQLPLHVAAARGHVQAAAALLEASPESAAVADRRGFTAKQWAHRRGVLQPKAAAAPASGAQTLLVAPDACLSHRTAPEPITRRSADVPPENVKRLHVLTSPDSGILRSSDFAALQWEAEPQPAAIADVLRVHEWSYVRLLQEACSAVPDAPEAVGQLDADTAICRSTFAAALAAAGAVCTAVDRVVGGQARNAFCAVRPPGHHAGPKGVVTCANDPHGSHGFCLLNNVAIGAAYAMNVHRHKGIRRVAIVDFDVHHGNGTEACVGGLTPRLAQHAFRTPYSEGVQTFPIFRPWLDIGDPDNVFFASVQGYGRRSAHGREWIYPASGATHDSRPPPQNAGDRNAVAGTAGDAGGAASGGTEVEEDPDGEFANGASDGSAPGVPRVVNVGISGPGADVARWKRSWRDKILPALVNFGPDLILISAGFDAHRKDVLNLRYIGIQEQEYEWITDQLVQVANRCCDGRIVSVLEGGYRTQGGIVSAFARSVAAHVAALQDPQRQAWDPEDAAWDRAREKRLRERHLKKAADKAAAAASVKAAAAASVKAAAEAAAAAASEQTAQETPAKRPDESEPAEAARSGKRARRGAGAAVDYVELNARLEKEAAAASAATEN